MGTMDCGTRNFYIGTIGEADSAVLLLFPIFFLKRMQYLDRQTVGNLSCNDSSILMHMLNTCFFSYSPQTSSTHPDVRRYAAGWRYPPGVSVRRL